MPDTIQTVLLTILFRIKPRTSVIIDGLIILRVDESKLLSQGCYKLVTADST